MAIPFGLWRNSLGLSFLTGKEAELNKYKMLGEQWDGELGSCLEKGPRRGLYGLSTKLGKEDFCLWP